MIEVKSESREIPLSISLPLFGEENYHSMCCLKWLTNLEKNRLISISQKSKELTSRISRYSSKVNSALLLE